MGDLGGDTQQPPRADGPSGLPPLNPEFVARVTGGISGAAFFGAVVLYLVEQSTSTPIARGAYGILAGIFAVAGCGYFVRSAEARVMRGLGLSNEQLRWLLREAYVAGALREDRVPPRGCAQVYRARAVDDDEDTRRLLPAGLDQESIRAARRISQRLRRPERG